MLLRAYFTFAYDGRDRLRLIQAAKGLKKDAHDAPGLEGFPILVLSIPVVYAAVLHDSPAMRLHRHPLHSSMQGLRQRKVKGILVSVSIPSFPSFQRADIQSQVCPATLRHVQCCAGDCRCSMLAGSADKYLYGDSICVHPHRSRPEVCAHITALGDVPSCAAATSMRITHAYA